MINQWSASKPWRYARGRLRRLVKTLAQDVAEELVLEEVIESERFRDSALGVWLAVLLSFLSPAVASTDAGTLDMMDVFDLEYATDPQISPRGDVIVYSRNAADVMSDSFYSNLWIIDFDGRNHRSLTEGKNHNWSPRWSPDGTQLAFISDREGSPQIFKLSLQYGSITRLTNIGTMPSGLNWSPDGQMISYVALVPVAPPSIASMPTPPVGAKWAEPARVIDKLVYRRDKEGYLQYGYSQIFIVPAEGGTPRQLTFGSYNYVWDSSAVWTPDSKYLIFSANLDSNYEYQPLESEIYQLAVRDGEIAALTDRDGPDSMPAVSPNGKYVAYVGFDDRKKSYQNLQLSIMKRDGSDRRVLTASLDRSVTHPVWSADGKAIFVVYTEMGNTKLARISLDGKITTVAGNIGGYHSAYSIYGSGYSISDNGRYAIMYSRPDRTGDIAVGRIGKKAEQPLTDLNNDVLARKTLGKVEEISFQSSIDGREIYGWIIKPPHFKPGEKYPLILEIHGGPFTNYGDRFDIEKQLMAARGYVVLYMNQRGSTSYGEEFSNLIDRSFPGDDFFDLNSGVDAAIKLGYVDKKRLFVTGGSAGGVLTLWTIGRSNRFRAAASLYPITNWYSGVLTSDLPAYFIQYWFPGFPWDNSEHYMQRSVISSVGKVKTPTLIITGEEDYRTTISESEQYYTALKLLKVDTVLVRVPDEPHGIKRHPSHYIAKIANIVSWFDRYNKESK